MMCMLHSGEEPECMQNIIAVSYSPRDDGKRGTHGEFKTGTRSLPHRGNFNFRRRLPCLEDPAPPRTTHTSRTRHVLVVSTHPWKLANPSFKGFQTSSLQERRRGRRRPRLYTWRGYDGMKEAANNILTQMGDGYGQPGFMQQTATPVKQTTCRTIGKAEQNQNGKGDKQNGQRSRPTKAKAHSKLARKHKHALILRSVCTVPRYNLDLSSTCTRNPRRQKKQPPRERERVCSRRMAFQRAPW